MIKMMDGGIKAVGRAALAMAVCVAASSVSLAQDFAGKTVTLISHSAPGGTYDLTTRLLARHIGRHLPGNPATIVENAVGAGGIVALNKLVHGCPGDGTCLMLVTPGLLTHELTDEPGLPASLGDVNWIGNFVSGNPVYVTWPTSRIKTLDDAKHMVGRVGATGVSSTNAQFPWAYNYLLGTKWEVIVGYSGAAEFDIAMARGELDGRSVTAFSSWMGSLPEDIRSNMHLILQLGTKKDPNVPESVPLLADLVKGDTEKEALVRLMSAVFSEMNLPFATGPDVPPETVATLREAFDATMADPDFIVDAEKMDISIILTTGQQLQDLVKATLSTSPQIKEKFKVMLQDPGQG